MTQPPVSYERWIDRLRERTGDVTDPVHRAMVDCFIEHMVAERTGDVDRFMRTMVDDCVYRSWGKVRPPGTPPPVRRREEIRALYEDMMVHRRGGFPEFEHDMERLFVGDDGLVMDGLLHRLARTEELEALGETAPSGAQPDDEHVVSRRTALFVSFRDGLMLGEDLYYDSSSTVTPVAP